MRNQNGAEKRRTASPRRRDHRPDGLPTGLHEQVAEVRRAFEGVVDEGAGDADPLVSHDVLDLVLAAVQLPAFR